ncbi:MAG: STAS domain-containing protein [Candidatus Eiseniibacteriota bacterium]
MKQRLEITRTDEAIILTPPSYLLGGDETRELERILQEEIEQGGRDVVLDFRRVEFMDSSALAVIISAHAASKTRGSRFYLQNCMPRIKSILQIMKLDLLLAENAGG